MVKKLNSEIALHIQLQKRLLEISEYLKDYDINHLDTIGLSYGKLGVALFHLIYHQFSKNSVHFDRANSIVNDVIDEVLEQRLSSKRLQDNVLDFGRFMEFSKKHKLFNCDTNSILIELDKVFNKRMINYLEIRDFDIAGGALSIGYYYLLRYNSTKSVEKYLCNLIDGIYKLSFQNGEDELYWVSPLFEKDRVYLGLHGSASIILFSVKLYELGIRKNTCLTIIKKASNFIVSNVINHDYCIFPIIVGHVVKRAPLEWAYGDLLVGYALYIAGTLTHDKEKLELAMKVYKKGSSRIYDKNVVVDSGLAHGVMGTAILYNKMYEYTNEISFANARDNCYHRSINDFTTKNLDFLGYKAKYDIDIPGSDISIMSGLSGIGLSLVASIDSKYHFFDELVYF